MHALADLFGDLDIFEALDLYTRHSTTARRWRKYGWKLHGTSAHARNAFAMAAAGTLRSWLSCAMPISRCLPSTSPTGFLRNARGVGQLRMGNLKIWRSMR